MASTVGHCFKLTLFMFVFSIPILMHSVESTSAAKPIVTTPGPNTTSLNTTGTGTLTPEWYNSLECENSGCNPVKFNSVIVGIHCCKWYAQIGKWIRQYLTPLCQPPNYFNVEKRRCVPAPKLDYSPGSEFELHDGTNTNSLNEPSDQ